MANKCPRCGRESHGNRFVVKTVTNPCTQVSAREAWKIDEFLDSFLENLRSLPEPEKKRLGIPQTPYNWA